MSIEELQNKIVILEIGVRSYRELYCSVFVSYSFKIPVSAPITYVLLGIRRVYAVTLLIKNKTKGIRDSVSIIREMKYIQYIY